MSIAQQSAVTLLGRNDKLPKLRAGPLASKEVPHLRLHVLPRKDGKVDSIKLSFVAAVPPAEDQVTTTTTDTDNDPLINKSAFTVFTQISASLLALREIYASTIEWVQVFDYDNLQDRDVNNTTQIDVGRTVGEADVEASELVHLGESFVGVTIHYGQTRHTFTKNETSETKPTTVPFVVPRNTKVYGYQRKYTFKYRVWLELRASNNLVGYNIGRDGEPRRERIIAVTILTEEFLVLETELPEETVSVEFGTVSDNVERALDAKTVYEIAEKITPDVQKA